MSTILRWLAPDSRLVVPRSVSDVRILGEVPAIISWLCGRFEARAVSSHTALVLFGEETPDEIVLIITCSNDNCTTKKQRATMTLRDPRSPSSLLYRLCSLLYCLSAVAGDVISGRRFRRKRHQSDMCGRRGRNRKSCFRFLFVLRTCLLYRSC